MLVAAVDAVFWIMIRCQKTDRTSRNISKMTKIPVELGEVIPEPEILDVIILTKLRGDGLPNDRSSWGEVTRVSGTHNAIFSPATAERKPLKLREKVFFFFNHSFKKENVFLLEQIWAFLPPSWLINNLSVAGVHIFGCSSCSILIKSPKTNRNTVNCFISQRLTLCQRNAAVCFDLGTK